MCVREDWHTASTVCGKPLEELGKTLIQVDIEAVKHQWGFHHSSIFPIPNPWFLVVLDGA